MQLDGFELLRHCTRAAWPRCGGSRIPTIGPLLMKLPRIGYSETATNRRLRSNAC